MSVLKDLTVLGDLTVTGEGKLKGSSIVNVDWVKKYFGKIIPSRKVLFSGNAASGNVTLSESWQNFDMIEVICGHDNGSSVMAQYYPTWLIKDAIANQNSNSKEGVCIFGGGINVYWSVTKASTGKTLTGYTENAVLRAVYGINFE